LNFLIHSGEQCKAFKIIHTEPGKIVKRNRANEEKK
jgi:hypothetical protein